MKTYHFLVMVGPSGPVVSGTYDTIDKAEKAAKSFAERNPGVEYVVMKPTTIAAVSLPKAKLRSV